MPRSPLLVLTALLLPVCVLAETPTNPVATTPAPVSTAVLKVASQFHTLAVNNIGTAGVTLTVEQCSTREKAVEALTQLRATMVSNGADPTTRDISVGTLDRLITTVRDDITFDPKPEEIVKIPKMLETQVQLDLLLNGRTPDQLPATQRGAFNQINTQYMQLMPKQTSAAPATTTPATVSEADPMAGMHAAVITNGPAAATPASTTPEPKSLMDDFHSAYNLALTQWKTDHPPGSTPTPAPTPTPTPGADPNSGGNTPIPPPNPSNWTGLPPSGHIGDMVDAHPNDPSVWNLSSQGKLASGDYAGAASDAQRALALGGGADARLNLGDAKYGMGDYPGAYKESKKILETEPENRGALALMHFAEPYAKVGAPKAPSFGGGPDAGGLGGAAGSASGSVLAVLNAAHTRGDPVRETTNALRLGDLDGALSYISRGLSQDPNNPVLLNLRATIYAGRRDYDKAAADAKAGLALAPKNKALLKSLAFAQVRGKHYKDALASADELVSLNPNDAYALALRANAHAGMGDRDAMMSDINRAAALDPRFQGMKAEMGKMLQLPADQDVLFLFPGEPPAGAKNSAPQSSRGRSFGLLVGASALGGLLLALGLLQTVLAPLKEKLTSAFTRITRSGPASAAAENDTAQPASVNGLVPGLIRGQYEIARQIGMGGMGMVFAGTDRSLGRPVAIKKMREELRINPAERARFIIEAKTVAALHHPNIVDIYAIAEDGQDVFLIFEFVDGKTVHDLISSAGRLPVAETALVVRASADALDYAHAHSVIHRDMKPSNVMVDASGRVKVMDFGIARMAKDSMTRYSMTNTVVGTPPYMAPEQEQGHVRKESDVYALAVCAYEMLTGKLPFVGIGAGMLMNKINMKYVAPSHAIAGLPEPLDEVFAKAFQADPDNRWRTPKEFADALESALPAAARA